MSEPTPLADQAIDLAGAMYQIAEGHEPAIIIAALCAIMAGLIANNTEPELRMAQLALDLLGLVRTLEAKPEENPLLFFERSRSQKPVHQ